MILRSHLQPWPTRCRSIVSSEVGLTAISADSLACSADSVQFEPFTSVYPCAVEQEGTCGDGITKPSPRLSLCEHAARACNRGPCYRKTEVQIWFCFAEGVSRHHMLRKVRQRKNGLPEELSDRRNTSPELMQDAKRDYSVYALDPLETQPMAGPVSIPADAQTGTALPTQQPQAVAVGLGLMSWALLADDESATVNGTLLQMGNGQDVLQVIFALRDVRIVVHSVCNLFSELRHARLTQYRRPRFRMLSGRGDCRRHPLNEVRFMPLGHTTRRHLGHPGPIIMPQPKQRAQCILKEGRLLPSHLRVPSPNASSIPRMCMSVHPSAKRVDPVVK